MFAAHGRGRLRPIQGTCDPLAAALLTAALRAVLLQRASSRSVPTLVIQGAGDGHGVGMSQEGALGYAQHGYSYQAILAHYYTGTALGTRAGGSEVRVLMDGKVAQVPLETYVRGVVGAEMPASWPLAALEAQAVASRTYAITDHAGGSALRRVRGHALAAVPGDEGADRPDERGGGGDGGPGGDVQRAARDHVLLRELGRRDRKTCRTPSRAPRRSRGWGAWRTPTTRAPSTAGA